MRDFKLFGENRTDIHKNARLSPHSRAQLVRRVLGEGQTRSAVAQAFGVSCKTVGKWVDRFLAEGPDGLRDHGRTGCSGPPLARAIP